MWIIASLWVAQYGAHAHGPVEPLEQRGELLSCERAKADALTPSSRLSATIAIFRMADRPRASHAKKKRNAIPEQAIWNSMCGPHQGLAGKKPAH